MKKLGLTTIALSALLLSGCGGSSSKKEKTITEQISERNYVLIMHNYPNGVCEDPRFKPLFQEGLAQEGVYISNLITHEEDNTASCALYGKSSTNCSSDLYNEDNSGNVACVIGFDSASGNKQLKKLNTFNISDTITTSALQII